MTTLATCWAFTINNPDENDYVLVRNPNEQYIREVVWTPEEAETPHIQGWLKLMRQQRLSFVKKLFPRAHWTPITNDVYNLNSRNYAQKDDETTQGRHTITVNPVVPDSIGFLTQLIGEYVEDAEPGIDLADCGRISTYLNEAERDHIADKPYLCKLVLSPIYTRAKKHYWKEILDNRIQHYATSQEKQQDSELHEAESTGSSGSEEEEEPEEGNSIEGSDTSSQSDCETEGGDETEY
jgi:hypothetical protein